MSKYPTFKLQSSNSLFVLVFQQKNHIKDHQN